MPKVIRQKNQKLISRITQYIKSEMEARKRLLQIVNNKDFYSQKI